MCEGLQYKITCIMLYNVIYIIRLTANGNSDLRNVPITHPKHPWCLLGVRGGSFCWSFARTVSSENTTVVKIEPRK